MEKINRIDDLKSKLKEAKLNNESYSVIKQLENEIHNERNRDTLKGAYIEMRKATANTFYKSGETEQKEIKKNLIAVLKESIKKIESVKVD